METLFWVVFFSAIFGAIVGSACMYNYFTSRFWDYKE